MAPATMVYYRKYFVKHDQLDTEAVVEIKVWEVSDRPHIHIDQIEQHYFFESIEKLVEDFYSLLKARGYYL